MSTNTKQATASNSSNTTNWLSISPSEHKKLMIISYKRNPTWNTYYDVSVGLYPENKPEVFTVKYTGNYGNGLIRCIYGAVLDAYKGRIIGVDRTTFRSPLVKIHTFDDPHDKNHVKFIFEYKHTRDNFTVSYSLEGVTNMSIVDFYAKSPYTEYIERYKYYAAMPANGVKIVTRDNLGYIHFR